MGKRISNFKSSNTEQFKFKSKWFDLLLSNPSWKGVLIFLFCIIGVVFLATLAVTEVSHILSTFATLFKK